MKYSFIRQHSEEDCGAACIAMIAKQYGRRFSLSHVREAVGTGQLGTSLLGLRRGAEGLGFYARSGKVTAEILQKFDIDRIPLPAIVHWKGKHWVVLYGRRRSHYIIADPATGIRYLSTSELRQGWSNGVMLLLVPDEAFYRQPNDKTDGFARFLQRVWPHRGTLLQAFTYAQLIGLLSLVDPFLIQFLTDDVLIRRDTDLLSTVTTAVIVLIVIKSVLSLVEYNLIAHLAQRLELGLTLEFGRKLLQLPLMYYESRRSGEVVSRLEDISRINGLISDVAVRLPSLFFTALVSFGFMLFYSQKLTLLSVAVAGAMTGAAMIFLPILQRKVRRVLTLDAENQGILVETFKGAMTVKTTAAQPQLWNELQSRFGNLASEEFKTSQVGILNSQFSGLVAGIGSICLLWFGSSLVINQELSIGQLLAFNGMNAKFVGFIGFLVRFADKFAKVKASVQRFTEVLDAQEETVEDWLKPFAEIPPDAEIKFNRVNFYYPGRTDLLQNFSLTIPGGKVTALVGTSGCGKSSLAKIIAGLHPYQSGDVRIGSYNMRDLSTECLRQQVVLIPQDAHFWSRSILENFRLCVPGASFEEIVEACQIAEADTFISRLPDGYQTVLGEFGSNLSGGQRQRLAIARSIIMQPPILILDESTSGLDPLSEAKVLKRLLNHRRGQTTILISHRPSVIQIADWVVILEEGKLDIEGSPQSLLAQDGEHLHFLRGVLLTDSDRESRFSLTDSSWE